MTKNYLGMVTMMPADEPTSGGGGDPWQALKPQGSMDMTDAVLRAMSEHTPTPDLDGEEEDESEGEESEDESEGDESEDESEGDESEDESEGDESEVETEVKISEAEKALREKLTTAEARLAELVAKQADKIVVRSVDVPLSDFGDVAAVERLETSAQDILDWCADHPDGGECPLIPLEDGKPKEFEGPEAVRALKQHVRGVLRTQIPARKVWLGQEAERVRIAQVAAPELFKDGSEVQKAALSVLQDLPQLRLVPGSRLLAHEIAVGRSLVKAFGPHTAGLVKDILAKVAAPKPKVRTAPEKRAGDSKPRPPETRGKPKPAANSGALEQRVSRALGF
jgi:hypothetical protein